MSNPLTSASGLTFIMPIYKTTNEPSVMISKCEPTSTYLIDAGVQKLFGLDKIIQKKLKESHFMAIKANSSQGLEGNDPISHSQSRLSKFESLKDSHSNISKKAAQFWENYSKFVTFHQNQKHYLKDLFSGDAYNTDTFWFLIYTRFFTDSSNPESFPMRTDKICAISPSFLNSEIGSNLYPCNVSKTKIFVQGKKWNELDLLVRVLPMKSQTQISFGSFSLRNIKTTTLKWATWLQNLKLVLKSSESSFPKQNFKITKINDSDDHNKFALEANNYDLWNEVKKIHIRSVSKCWTAQHYRNRKRIKEIELKAESSRRSKFSRNFNDLIKEFQSGCDLFMNDFGPNTRILGYQGEFKIERNYLTDNHKKRREMLSCNSDLLNPGDSMSGISEERCQVCNSEESLETNILVYCSVYLLGLQYCMPRKMLWH